MNPHIEHDHEHGHSLYDELVCHFPYAIFSVALCLALLSFLDYTTMCSTGGLGAMKKQGSHDLFHVFHFMHIVFATTGSMITSLRFSKSKVLAVIISIISPTIFCIFSDVLLPYLGGCLLGVPMHLHICFYSELHNILPMMLFGLLNGFAMSKHPASSQGAYSLFSHFVHILVSSLASVMYLVSHGFNNWYEQIGFIFIFLTIAVVVPCTLSDVVVPMAFAGANKDHEKH